MFYEYLLVFLGSATPWIEPIIVVPLAIMWGLSPFWVMVVAFSGNLTTIIALVIGFEKVSVWHVKRQEKKGKAPSKRSERALKSWNKYGLPGVSFLGPILIGTHISAFLGMSLGTHKLAVISWTVGSIALWIIIFATATMFGFDLFIKNV